ncbi:MAG: LamG domain-containing protein, partial [Anaerolineales bacterium]
MTPTPFRLSLPRRAAALAAAVGLGLALLALCWRGVAAQAPAAAQAAGAIQASAAVQAPAGAVWFVNNQPGEGLAGYWKFDQVTNTTTVNSIRLDQAATLFNGATISFALKPPLGIPNFDKLALDGVSQYAQVAADPALDVGASHFSLAVWARRTGTNNYDAIYDSGTQLGKWWVFIADGSAGKLNRFGFGKRGSYELYSNHTITDTDWHHLAVVVDGTGAGNLTFYVDGAASGTVTASGILTPTGSKLIGALSDGGLFAQFGGDLDELRLYDRSLSAAEVARLAQGRGCVTDGQTWGTAFADLQCALEVAAAGDDVWVAKSIEPYRPGTSPFARFNLVSGVGVFGNFQGTETSRGQRPPVNFELVKVSTLSGDLLDDDNLGQFSDNAHNVVDANGTGAGTLLDGVRVQSGLNPDLIGGGGGGLRLHASGQLSVLNSLFIQNRAVEAGGALLESSGVITLDNVIFDTNSALVGGAAALLADGVIVGGR